MHASLPIKISPLALRRSRLFESVDLDYVRDCIATVLQPHSLLPQGRRLSEACHLDHVAICRVGIGTIHFGAAQVHVPEFEDYHLFLTCLTGNGLLQVEGDECVIDQTSGVLIAPGEQMLATFSRDCEQLFVRIERNAIVDHVGMRKIRFKRTVDLASLRMGPWLRQVALLAGDYQAIKMSRNLAGLATEYEQLLVRLLLAGQSHVDDSARPFSIAPGSVKRAEEFIHAHFAQTVTLADISGYAGVPARTLLDSFRRFRGTSPVRYLRETRLDAAREALQSGRVKTATQAAVDAGIYHLGRFAKDYASRFGEQPSETLRRTRI